MANMDGVSFLALATALALLAALFGNRLPQAYARRKCQGRAWRAAFPASPSAELRDFLTMFTRAFALPEKEKLKLRPDDSISSIYSAIYSRWWMKGCDALEFESLAKAYEATYGQPFAPRWHQHMTLGDLFASATEDRPSSRGLTRRVR